MRFNPLTVIQEMKACESPIPRAHMPIIPTAHPDRFPPIYLSKDNILYQWSGVSWFIVPQPSLYLISYQASAGFLILCPRDFDRIEIDLPTFLSMYVEQLMPYEPIVGDYHATDRQDLSEHLPIRIGEYEYYGIWLPTPKAASYPDQVPVDAALYASIKEQFRKSYADVDYVMMRSLERDEVVMWSADIPHWRLGNHLDINGKVSYILDGDVAVFTHGHPRVALNNGLQYLLSKLKRIPPRTMEHTFSDVIPELIDRLCSFDAYPPTNLSTKNAMPIWLKCESGTYIWNGVDWKESELPCECKLRLKGTFGSLSFYGIEGEVYVLNAEHWNTLLYRTRQKAEGLHP